MIPVSPNTVLANALVNVDDVVALRIVTSSPKRIVFVVGTQINGSPHIGTSLVQTVAFATAARVRERHGLDVDVLFSALDNAPLAVVTDDASGHRYQRAYAQAWGEPDLIAQVKQWYGPLMDGLSRRFDMPYRVQTYSQQQAEEDFRRTWLRVLPRMDAARWWLAPSTGVPHLRVPCPERACGWAEKDAERTQVHRVSADRADVDAVCLHHGPYRVTVEPAGGAYLDLATLYRNLVKELSALSAPEVLHVMVKGGDWVFGSTLVDGALQAVGLTQGQLPLRLFCPQVVTGTGAKLSKSLILDGGPASVLMDPWMLDTRLWPGSPSEYVDTLVNLAELVLSDPRHFFRSYSAAELGRMMASTARKPPAP